MTLIKFDLSGPEVPFYQRALELHDDMTVELRGEEWGAWFRDAWMAGVEDPDKTYRRALRVWLAAFDQGIEPEDVVLGGYAGDA